MNNVFKIWFIIFVIWTFFRAYFRFPEWVDELIVKPVVFVILPITVLKLKTVPGFESKKTVNKDLIIGVGMGIVFGFASLLANKLKYGSFSFDPTIPLLGSGLIVYLGLSLATSISEEVLGRGIFFSHFRKDLGVIDAACVSSMLSLSLHFPIVFTQLNYDTYTFFIFIISVFVLSMINSILYHFRGNLVLPILLHLFWNMSVALYL